MISIFKHIKNRKQPDGTPAEPQVNTAENQLSRVDSFLKRVGETMAASPEQFGEKILSLIARENEIIQGAIYMANQSEQDMELTFLSGYACNKKECREIRFKPGEGFPGQVFSDQTLLNLKDFPEGYVKIRTGLGEASPRSLLLFPLIDSGTSAGVVELASFREFTKADELFYTALSGEITRQIKNSMKKEKQPAE
jgi:signal transduction protein with GAF and PtsI domain